MGQDVRYVKEGVNKKWLQKHNFMYNKNYSDDETEVYSYRFPVYKHESYTVLECELSVVFGDPTVIINVYDYGSTAKYAPFYYAEYGVWDKMLTVIWRNIDRKLKQLDIVKQGGEEESDESGGI